MITVVGIKKIVSKKDSNVYYELHMNAENRFVDGYEAYSIFVGEDQISNVKDLCVGCLVDVTYNRFARPDKVLVLV